MIKYDLNNRVAVVTGGAQGFGLAITERFIEAGAKVIIWDIDEKAAKEAINKVKSENVSHQIVDVTNFEIVNKNLKEVEKQIIKVLETKVRPAVARDGGDIKFQEFKYVKVKVLLKGSCSGCPSSTLTLKKGVENLLCHYIPEVKEVLAV